MIYNFWCNEGKATCRKAERGSAHVLELQAEDRTLRIKFGSREALIRLQNTITQCLEQQDEI